jgi:diacylglycerol O-acyltransferase
VYLGLNGDRDAMSDLDVLGQCVIEALEELVDSTSPTRMRAPRGRTGKKPARS